MMANGAQASIFAGLESWEHWLMSGMTRLYIGASLSPTISRLWSAAVFVNCGAEP